MMAKREKLGGTLYQIPLISPESSWVMPDHFPDLSAAKKIAIDTETKDPHLKEMGPGFVRGDAHIVGVSICTDDLQFKAYYPVAHGEGPNLPKNVVFPWLKEQLGRENQEKVLANAIYDAEGLSYSGIEIKGRIHDVQTAEPLLNEESLEGYSLDVLAKKYLGEGKEESLLQEAAFAYRDGKRDKQWLKNMKSKLWIYPAKLVGPYAEIDALRTMEVHEHQMPLIEKEELGRVYDVECRLIKLLLAMRLKGVPFDVDAAQNKSKEWKKREALLLQSIMRHVGFAVDPWTPGDLSKLYRYYGIEPPLTDKGNPSFENDVMANLGVPDELKKEKPQDRAEKCKYPALQYVVAYRKLNKMRRDFVDGYQEMVVRGKIHPQFHPLRKDAEGTRSGRLSSSNPNAQQVPHRDPEFGPEIRGLFIPEEGKIWIKRDVSQQEPRLTVHYAYLRNMPGAEAAWKQFKENPFTDYHQLTADLAGITRKHAKGINLGLAYGMGKDKLARQLGMTMEEAEPIFKLYHERLPYMKLLAVECESYAQRRGYIRTILGRRRHFELWEPDVPFERGVMFQAYPLEKARQIYGDKKLKRSQTRKAMNSLIQGGGADMTKMAMLNEYEQFNEVPHIQVHDELSNSVESLEYGVKLREAFETCLPEITVPMVVEMEYGPNWGHTVLYDDRKRK